MYTMYTTMLQMSWISQHVPGEQGIKILTLAHMHQIKSKDLPLLIDYDKEIYAIIVIFKILV